MKQEDFEWLSERPHLLGNVRLSQQDAKRLFDIYNDITGENKPITSCGRCVHSVKQRLKVEYEIISNLPNRRG